MEKLSIGRYADSTESFRLSVNAQVETFAIIGKRGSGKTVLATVMAEEMCKKGLLWIAFDPVSVFWGLRAKKDGTPGGFPVVVFGGKHGDIPIGRDDGKRIAEVVATENVFAVIDVKNESKKFWHTFMTDLALGLMDQEPETPRHIFIEEAPEMVPQKTRVDLTQRCKEAVERLVRLGRNQGYGCTLISQRCATIDKDVLSVAPWMRSPVQIPKNNAHGGFSVGLRTMEEIWRMALHRASVEKEGEVEMLHLPKTSRLKTLCHRNGMGWWAPIRTVIRHPYKGPLIRLMQKWGEVVVTPNHSVYSADGSLCRPQDNPELLAARTVNQQHTRDDDSVVLAAPDSNFRFDGRFFKPTGSGRPSRLKFKLSGEELKSFLRFLGAWLSEGSVHQRKEKSGKRGSYIIRVANTDRAWLKKRLVDLRVFAEPACAIYACSKSPIRTKECWNLVARNKALGKWLEKNCGKGAENKRLPDFVFNLKREYVDELISTMVDGDGHRYKNGRWMYFTKSPELAQGLGLLLSLHGQGYTIGKDEKTKVYRVLQCDWYNHRDAEKRTMETVPFDGYVYDLEIDDRYSHNFVIGVGNVVVHNSQCESLFVLRSVGKHDYNALKDWLKAAKGEDSVQPRDLKDLATLPSGTAYFWSPQWAGEFTKIRVRERETFHPGETRTVGVAAKSVELSPIHEVVARLQRKLSKVQVAVPAPEEKKSRATREVLSQVDLKPAAPHPETLEELEKLKAENSELRSTVSKLRGQVKEVNGKLDGVREAMKPQYKALQSLFQKIGETQAGAEDLSKWEGWLKKAGVRGCRRSLEVMLEKRRLTAIQLATLSGISYRTFKNYRSWLKSNGLISIEGDGESATIILIPMA